MQKRGLVIPCCYSLCSVIVSKEGYLHNEVSMNFPALLVFDDGKLKVIESAGDIRGDIDWCCSNYADDDFIIDGNLQTGRFARYSEQDKVIAMLTESVIQRTECSEAELRSIAVKLKEIIKGYDELSEEVFLGNKLIKKIKDQTNA